MASAIADDIAKLKRRAAGLCGCERSANVLVLTTLDLLARHGTRGAGLTLGRMLPAMEVVWAGPVGASLRERADRRASGHGVALSSSSQAAVALH